MGKAVRRVRWDQTFRRPKQPRQRVGQKTQGAASNHQINTSDIPHSSPQPQPSRQVSHPQPEKKKEEKKRQAEPCRSQPCSHGLPVAQGGSASTRGRPISCEFSCEPSIPLFIAPRQILRQARAQWQRNQPASSDNRRALWNRIVPTRTVWLSVWHGGRLEAPSHGILVWRHGSIFAAPDGWTLWHRPSTTCPATSTDWRLVRRGHGATTAAATADGRAIRDFDAAATAATADRRALWGFNTAAAATAANGRTLWGLDTAAAAAATTDRGIVWRLDREYRRDVVPQQASRGWFVACSPSSPPLHPMLTNLAAATNRSNSSSRPGSDRRHRAAG